VRAPLPFSFFSPLARGEKVRVTAPSCSFGVLVRFRPLHLRDRIYIGLAFGSRLCSPAFDPSFGVRGVSHVLRVCQPPHDSRLPTFFETPVNSESRAFFFPPLTEEIPLQGHSYIIYVPGNRFSPLQAL